MVTRFGVITGPGQMGKVDQGVFALWMARHVFGGTLRYQGWGGAGKQVRDTAVDMAISATRSLLRERVGTGAAGVDEAIAELPRRLNH